MPPENSLVAESSFSEVGLSRTDALNLYTFLRLSREIDNRSVILYRQGAAARRAVHGYRQRGGIGRQFLRKKFPPSASIKTPSKPVTPFQSDSTPSTPFVGWLQ